MCNSYGLLAGMLEYCCKRLDGNKDAANTLLIAALIHESCEGRQMYFYRNMPYFILVARGQDIYFFIANFATSGQRIRYPAEIRRGETSHLRF